MFCFTRKELRQNKKLGFHSSECEGKQKKKREQPSSLVERIHLLGAIMMRVA
jgi:hypothetical protein